MGIIKSVFDEVGGLDEQFHEGFDDVDLCLTVSHAGYGIWYEPSAIVWHWESATGPERWFFSQHNATYLRAKWAEVDFDDNGYLHPRRATAAL